MQKQLREVETPASGSQAGMEGLLDLAVVEDEGELALADSQN